MTEPIEEWHARNATYLSAALAWLRARLERHAQQIEPAPRIVEPSADAPPRVPAAPQASSPGRWPLLRRASPAGVAAPMSSPRQLAAPAPQVVNIDQVEAAAAAVAEAEAGDPPPALIILAHRLGLSDFERDILLLCVAMELDTRIPSLCAYAQADPARPWPTYALAMAVFDDPAWEALSPERPLRYWRLLEINQQGAQPLTSSALRADERIVSFVKGLNYLDDRLGPLVTLDADAPRLALPPSQMQAVESLVAGIASPRANSQRTIIALSGGDSPSKAMVARAASEALRLQLYRLPAEVLPTHAGELESLARLWRRESMLLPVALYIDARRVERKAGSEGLMQSLGRFALRAGGVIFFDGADDLTDLVEPAHTVEVHKPTPAEQRATWRSALGESADDEAALLAGQFDLNLADISDIAVRVGSEPSGRVERLWRECRAKTRPKLASVAESLVPKAAWDDIVLPSAEAALLRQIGAQVAARSRVYDEWGFRARMNRGLGISALFAGGSGTGKTMAAEVLANALKLDLFRIDLSAVVSKYIGETEKNLRLVFDAAEAGGAILFFDEADALFGKRSEVKDAHDRYANIEINYLLQRMEAYRGLCVLATNMKNALDPAFMRRLRFIVNFPYPGIAERRSIWERVFPPQTPRAGLDHQHLAKLDLTGGNIHSIALNAAFLAATANTQVTMPLILEAARTELRKLDRSINEAELRWVEAPGAAA